MADERNIVLLQGESFNNIKELMFSHTSLGVDVRTKYSGGNYNYWSNREYFSAYVIHNMKKAVLIVSEEGYELVYTLGDVSYDKEELYISFGKYGGPILWKNFSDIFSDVRIDTLIKNKVIWSFGLLNKSKQEG
jgi:hypothetical protein